MVFFWRGLGFLVPIIVFGMLIGMSVLFNLVYSDEHFYYSHTWPKVFSVGLTALTIWVVGRRLNDRPGRVMIDKATQKEYILKSSHDFMFVKMEYWAVIMVVVISIIVFAKK